MNKKQVGLQIIFWGSIWGLQEVLIDTFCYYNKSIPRSVLLGIAAIFILAMASKISDDKYLTTKIGVVAAFYKFLNILFFPCQFFAVMLFGLYYNIQALLVKKLYIKNVLLQGLFVIAMLMIFNLSFGLAATYIFKYSYWLENSKEKLFRFLFIEGSITVIAGYFSFLLGDFVGKKLKPKVEKIALQRSGVYVFSTAGVSSIVLILMFIL